MRLASFRDGRRTSFGAVVDGGIVDLGRRLGPEMRSVRALLAAGGLEGARRLARATPDVGLDEVQLLRPVIAPEKVLCVGVNYVNRNEEYRDASALPAFPSVFMRTPGSLVGHGETLVIPHESSQLDYEGEIAIVIGLGGRRIPEADAARHIAGVTCMNEGTIRDWTRHGKFNVTQGKNFERTGALGPWLVTSDELEGFDDLQVSTRVNGERRQHDTTANLLFPFRYLVSYLSTFTALAPGDVIATGTPTGAGIRHDPPRFLVEGDRVEVEVSGVGILANAVAREAPASAEDRE